MWIAKFWFQLKPNQVCYLQTEVDPNMDLLAIRTDPVYLHLKSGKVPRHLIKGEVQLEWQPGKNTEGNGQDSLPKLLLN